MIASMIYLIYGNDEKLLEETIQSLIVEQEENRHEGTDIEPIQMQNGREIDLSLANIVIYQPPEPTDDKKSSYQYLLSKKLEELTLDRLEQLKKAIQEKPDFYNVETYLREYEQQTGSKLSEIQIQGIREFSQKIQDGVIIGKYNLRDYMTFLQSLPDLLSRTKFLGIGHFDQDGIFWEHGKIVEPSPSTEDIYNYNLYTYHRLTGALNLTNDNYRIISSPSIKYRMKPDADKLCCIDVAENTINFFSPEAQETIAGQPNIKCIGTSRCRSIYSDNSGILFIGVSRSKIKEKSEISANNISTDLAEISRESLTKDAQAHLTELANKSIQNEKNEEKQL